MKLDIKQLEGYAYGAVQPSITIRFHGDTGEEENLTAGLKNIYEKIPRFEDENRFSTNDQDLNQHEAQALCVTILDTLNHYFGDKRFSPIQIFQDDKALCFSLPTLSTEMSRFNMSLLQTLLKIVSEPGPKNQIIDLLETQKTLVRKLFPSGTNAGNFLVAAAKLKIPFKIFSRNYIIFGYGAGSRIFNSSITDEESAIGVRIAKSKAATNSLLKMSGIPVAEQARVRSIDDAIIFVNNFGYPVVLKPESEDRGRGVFANIVGEAELRDCWSLLSKGPYKSVLIEKHLPGDIYRINTINGSVVRAVKRVHPFVCGDGVSTIEQLISEINEEPIRTGDDTVSEFIDIDDDVTRTLAKESLTIHSILGKNETLHITSTCRSFNSDDFIDKLHTDNRDLCEKVSRIMRLNVTGIDVISVDAADSWRSRGFHICEVNAQPQLGDTHINIYADFLMQKLKLGTSIKLLISLEGQEKFDVFDPLCDSVTINLTPTELLKNGSPVQYFDYLEIQDEITDEDKRKIRKMLISIKPEIC